MEVSGQPHAPAALLRENVPSTQWIGDWMDFWTLWVREKILVPTGNRTPGRQSRCR
jgi:hypothetical protein